MSFQLDITSRLIAPAAAVWAAVRTMEGVNAELAPWVRMSVPAAARGLTIDDAPLDRPAFDSWLLALGVVPFDRHRLTLVEVRPGHFVERSSSLLQRLWRHERDVAAGLDGTTIVRDQLFVEPRLPVSFLVRPIVAAIFRWRHRRLQARFGAA